MGSNKLNYFRPIQLHHLFSRGIVVGNRHGLMLLLIITSTFVYDHLSCSFADAVNCLDYQVMSDDPCCCHEGRRTPEYPPEFLCRKFAIPLWLDSYLNSGLAIIRKINRITVLLLVSRIRQRSWIFEIHDDYSYYDGPCSTPQARSKFYPFFGNLSEFKPWRIFRGPEQEQWKLWWSDVMDSLSHWLVLESEKW